MIDFLKAAFKNLGRKRARTSLTILGIAIGVASVIIIGNISQCGTDALNNELESLGLSGLSISAYRDKSVFLNQNDLNMIQKNEQVEQATPVIMMNTNISVCKLNSKALVWGVDTKANQIISIHLLYGRMFNQEDIRDNANVCLVDENLSKSSYYRSNIVGKKVSILCGGVMEEFKVVGIIKTGSGLLQNIIGDYIPTFIYVPYTTLQSDLGKDYFDQIAVKVKNDADVDKIGETIVDSLNRSNGTSDAYLSSNLAKQRDSLTSMLDIVTLILSAVGAISLLVASLSIMTVMLVSVNERTREIGIKKAIGAKRSSIMLEFLFEAALISLIGCFLGIASGYLVSFAGTLYYGIALSVRFDIMFLAIGFSFFTGIVFGVYPAYKASRLNPVDALRME
jgi:putative ABC transport system permease protein